MIPHQSLGSCCANKSHGWRKLSHPHSTNSPTMSGKIGKPPYQNRPQRQEVPQRPHSTCKGTKRPLPISWQMSASQWGDGVNCHPRGNQEDGKTCNGAHKLPKIDDRRGNFGIDMINGDVALIPWGGKVSLQMVLFHYFKMEEKICLCRTTSVRWAWSSPCNLPHLCRGQKACLHDECTSRCIDVLFSQGPCVSPNKLS